MREGSTLHLDHLDGRYVDDDDNDDDDDDDDGDGVEKHLSEGGE